MATIPTSESGDDGEWDYVVGDRDEPELNTAAILPGLCMGGSFPDGEVPEDDSDPDRELSPTWVLDWVTDNPAGPASMTLLAGLAPRSSNSFDRVRLMEAWDRQVAHCEAMKLSAMKAVVDDDANLAEFVSHEIAAALHLSRPAADRLVALCRRLARTLPGTARALADGLISQGHAAVLSEETAMVSVEVAGQVEDTLLPSAGTKTVGQRRTHALVEWANGYLAGPDAPTQHGKPVTVDLVIDLPTPPGSPAGSPPTRRGAGW